MRWLALLVALAAVGCHHGGSSVATPDLASPDLATSEFFGNAHPSGVVSTPTEHRANPAACGPAPSLPPCQGGGNCTTAADCTAGQNGRCIGAAITGCSCVYDQCNADSDCPSGQDCACHVTYRSSQGAGPNQCVPANCASDSDCAGGFCSPSYALAACQSYVDGYYCHTAQDECGVNSDCVADDIGYAACVYRPELGHWACALEPFCSG